MTGKRIAVTGGRTFHDPALVSRALSTLPADAVLVHGGAVGADTLCAAWWGERRGRAVEEHPADWKGPCRDTCPPGHRKPRPFGGDYCPAAGIYRNQEMVDSGLDALIQFPGGHGTYDMVDRALRAGVEVCHAELMVEGWLS